VFADRFFGRITLEPLGTRVPTADITLFVEGEDSVVLDALDETLIERRIRCRREMRLGDPVAADLIARDFGSFFWFLWRRVAPWLPGSSAILHRLPIPHRLRSFVPKIGAGTGAERRRKSPQEYGHFPGWSTT